jgi:hypothetical protein
MTKEEIIYLGMDKLSFYITVDFEQIPILKQALVDSNIWATKLVLDEQFLDGKEITEEHKLKVQNKTNFVKNFFDKREF